MLEAESIHILREVVAEFARPVMLYSIGKDSSVMLRLAQKAFHPGRIPFPLLHVDTGYKFREMIEFRDRYTAEIGARLIVHQNRRALEEGASPFRLGTQKCCGLPKTRALLDALAEGGFDAAFGGARRDEEKSRANERVSSFRDALGQSLAFWTWKDVWSYVRVNEIKTLPLYEQGYPSIGCEPCTALPTEAGNPRSGRWGGQKLECGIHTFDAGRRIA
jgi:3'-phosphoadenosine 5'-phosphosulfate sulfotransferase (PAPS reductase)/FAD synthetase